MSGARKPAVALLLVLAVVGAALLATYWLGGGAVGGAPGDPTSPAPDGGAAVARLLGDKGGIAVRRAGSVEEMGDTSGATVVIAATGALDEDTLDALSDATADAGSLVLIRPHADTLREFAPGVRAEGSTSGVLGARCRSRDVDGGEEISGSSQLYRLTPGTRSGAVCFTQAGGGTLPGTVVSVGSGAQRVTVVGNRDVFSNAHLADLDNAAVALRILGHHRQVVWFTGTQQHTADASPRAERLWPPPWLAPLVLALLGALAATMLWRGRRLGRLAREPLPVIVQANETTLARGRLYRRSREPLHAARILQDATRRRLSLSLGLPDTSDVAAVATAVERTGRAPASAVSEALIAAPASDAELGRLAGTLTALEKEVRRT